MTDPLGHIEDQPQEDLEEPAGAVEVLTTPTPIRIDLHDAHAIRRELGAVYRDMRAGRIEMQDGTKLAFVLELLRKSYETCLVQGRLEALEQLLNARKEKRHERR